MIKVDLITGFLGSGKTTFIKKYARYFMDQGQKIGILENDYGAVNVDMLLLNELRGENCELEMVAGACDADCHKRRFKTKLISMGMSGYNRVIIEPSGIFDIDEFFDSLHEEPLDRWYEIGNVITLVDARLESNMSEAADYFLASQLASAGAIVLSRSQLAHKAQIDETIRHLHSACQAAGLKKPIEKLLWDKPWDDLTQADMEVLSRCSYTGASYVKKINSHDNDFDTLYFLEEPLNLVSLQDVILTLFADNSYGEVIRIKGFLEDQGDWFQINATKKECDICRIPVGQQVFIVIGENLKKDKIKELIKGYH